MLSLERRTWIEHMTLGAAVLLAADACLLMAIFLGETPQGEPSPFAVIGFPACGALLTVGGTLITMRETGQSVSRTARLLRRYARVGSFAAIGAASLVSIPFWDLPRATTARIAVVATGGLCLTASLSAISGFAATALRRLRGETPWGSAVALAASVLGSGVFVTGSQIWVRFWLSPGDIADARVPEAIHAILASLLAIIICGAWLAVTLIRIILEGWRQLHTGRMDRTGEKCNS